MKTKMNTLYIVMELDEFGATTENKGAYRTPQAAQRECARLTWQDYNLDVIGEPVCTYYIMEAELKG